jgi:hypothetical protein
VRGTLSLRATQNRPAGASLSPFCQAFAGGLALPTVAPTPRGGANASQGMRILWVSNHSPLHVDFGGGQRSRLIYRTLREIGEVDVLIIAPPDPVRAAYQTGRRLRTFTATSHSPEVLLRVLTILPRLARTPVLRAAATPRLSSWCRYLHRWLVQTSRSGMGWTKRKDYGQRLWPRMPGLVASRLRLHMWSPH